MELRCPRQSPLLRECQSNTRTCIFTHPNPSEREFISERGSLSQKSRVLLIGELISTEDGGQITNGGLKHASRRLLEHQLKLLLVLFAYLTVPVTGE